MGAGEKTGVRKASVYLRNTESKVGDTRETDDGVGLGAASVSGCIHYIGMWLIDRRKTDTASLPCQSTTQRQQASDGMLSYPSEV